MRQAARVVILSGAVVLGTWGFGWWTVSAIAVAWGVVAPPTDRPGWTAALAAALAWALLLGWGAITGPVGALADKVGPIFGLPGPVLVLVTLVFPAALAGLGATGVRWLRTVNGTR